MPLRDPELTKDGICPPFEPPTSQLRSPEDDLTLWQFMSVSWMTPLISLGSTRQLNDEDVWSLAFEFQHSILHESFRALRGSVVRRLVVANGLDLVIISSFAVLESLASKQNIHNPATRRLYLTLDSDLCTPVLLQQLLRSLETSDTRRGAAVIYAMLSLLVRLIAGQSSVFNLWFSRRCYERSRGEMITMLYEKTLSRKIIGASIEPQKTVNSDGMDNSGPPMNTTQPKSRWKSIWEGLYGAKDSLISTTNDRLCESKKPASIGKILNLMRHASLAKSFRIITNIRPRNDVYEVAQRYCTRPNLWFILQLTDMLPDFGNFKTSLTNLSVWSCPLY